MDVMTSIFTYGFDYVAHSHAYTYMNRYNFIIFKCNSLNRLHYRYEIVKPKTLFIHADVSFDRDNIITKNALHECLETA